MLPSGSCCTETLVACSQTEIQAGKLTLCHFNSELLSPLNQKSLFLSTWRFTSTQFTLSEITQSSSKSFFNKDKFLHVLNNTTKDKYSNILIHSFSVMFFHYFSLPSYSTLSLTHIHQRASHHSDSASPAVVCGNSLHRQEVECVYLVCGTHQLVCCGGFSHPLSFFQSECAAYIVSKLVYFMYLTQNRTPHHKSSNFKPSGH